MYSLFVSHLIEERSEGPLEIASSRFLEYTSNSISAQLRSLSTEARECIRSWPCILMQEGRGQKEAYIAQIKDIKVSGANVKLMVESLPSEPGILNDALWKIRDNLDIEQFEFNRTHWAIKDQDLLPILAAAGYRLDAAVVTRFDSKPLPAPSRSDLIGARNTISEWSHTEIDDFLLEAGVNNLDAGRAVGSRRDRANLIIKFAIENTDATTAENSLFSTYIIRATTSPISDVENADQSGGTYETVVDAVPGRLPPEIDTTGREPNQASL